MLGNWRWIVFFLVWGLCLGVVLGGRPGSLLWYLACVYLSAALFVTARKFWRTRAELLFLREFHHLSQTLDDIRALETQNPFDPILALVIRIVGFDRAVLLLIDRRDGKMRPVRSYGVPEAELAALPSPVPAESLMWQLLRRGEILLIPPDDPALSADSPIRSLAGGSQTICLPIQHRRQDIGVLLLFHSDLEAPISDDVLLQLQILIDQIGISLHNLTLHQELREKAHELEQRDTRMNKELELARLVQEGVLPWSSPAWPGLSISVFFRPARFIGGDYYSYLDACSHSRRDCTSKSCRHCSHETLGLLVGDACGKGIPASLIMAVVTSLFREKIAHVSDPAQLLNEVNLTVKDYLGAETRFNSSAFVGFFNPGRRTFTYANAGHDFPLYYQASLKSVIPLESTGTLLGLFRESTYQTRTIEMQPGDRILFYTDGLTDFFEDCTGASDGYQALTAFFLAHLNLSPEEFTRTVKEMVELKSGEKCDDITALVVQVEDSART